MNTTNSKISIQINLFTISTLIKNPNKNIALANLSIYYTWKNVKSDYNNK